jgi:ubiquitin carboxyl-terminal hydrolase 5/13
MMKLAIIEEREEDKYEHVLALHCYRSTTQDPVDIPMETVTRAVPRIQTLVDGVMKSLSSARQEEVQAWEEELIPCEHTLTLAQFATGPIPPFGTRPHFPPAIILDRVERKKGSAHCAQCDLKENLWLCLTCGVLGCGRQHYGGIGGNGHALTHFKESTHPVCVKLGTITPEGTAGQLFRTPQAFVYQ